MIQGMSGRRALGNWLQITSFVLVCNMQLAAACWTLMLLTQPQTCSLAPKQVWDLLYAPILKALGHLILAHMRIDIVKHRSHYCHD